jgi:hypothetical protein
MLAWLFRSHRRKRLLAEPLPAQWLEILERNVGHYRLLPPPLQKRLADATRIVVSERTWVGCKGLTITDEHKVTIAAQASLLLLGVEDYYFEKLPAILVYPGNYVRPQRLGDHGFLEAEAILEGESWARGSIVLSWPTALAGGRDPTDGDNLVLHEFAHHLDCLDGEPSGHPPQPSSAAAEKWDRVIDLEFGRLQRALAAGEATLLDPYAAESKAEFFSVATEVFYEQPIEMRSEHSALYELLRGYFRVDPAGWFSATAVPQAPAEMMARPQPSQSADRDADESEAQDHKRQDDRPSLARAEDYFNRGWDAILDGRYEEAEADFSEVLRHNPKDVEALVHLAECRLQLGRVRQALKDAKRAAHLDPNDGEAIRIRGICRVALGQWALGLSDLDAAVKRGADNGELRYHRGLALAELGRWQEAIDEFTAAIAADRYDAEAYMMRGDCYDEIGDLAAAKRDWQVALELDPSLADE